MLFATEDRTTGSVTASWTATHRKGRTDEPIDSRTLQDSEMQRFLDTFLYREAAFLIDEVMKMDSEQRFIEAQMDTLRPLPFSAEQRVGRNHPAHVSGAEILMITGSLGCMHAWFFTAVTGMKVGPDSGTAFTEPTSSDWPASALRYALNPEKQEVEWAHVAWSYAWPSTSGRRMNSSTPVSNPPCSSKKKICQRRAETISHLKQCDLRHKKSRAKKTRTSREKALKDYPPFGRSKSRSHEERRPCPTTRSSLDSEHDPLIPPEPTHP